MEAKSVFDLKLYHHSNSPAHIIQGRGPHRPQPCFPFYPLQPFFFFFTVADRQLLSEQRGSSRSYGSVIAGEILYVAGLVFLSRAIDKLFLLDLFKDILREDCTITVGGYNQ